MKLNRLVGWSSALCLSVSPLQAQETKNEVEELKKQLQQATENFQKAMEQHRQVIESLNKKIEAMQQQQIAVTNEQQKLREMVGPPPSVASTNALTAGLDRKWQPTDPIRFGNAQNYINLSFDALVAAGYSTAEDIESLELGGHDPKQRGFTVQNLETVFEGKVDPYFRGQANVVLQIDPEGETTIEAEEAYLETMALPWNLQAKAGQFFTEFGRLNPQHPHAWDFVDQPLVYGRFFGEDNLRNPGARVSWLTPTRFYSELFFAVQNSQGETAHSFRDSNEGEPLFDRPSTQGRVKSLGDMLFSPRYAASFNLSDAQTLVAGVSAAFGPNGTGSDTDTQIYGLDLYWKWKPVNHHGGFPFVSWQTEALLRHFQAGAFNWDLDGNGAVNPDGSEEDLNGDGVPDVLPRETLDDYGFYSQIAYGFKKGWVAGLRGEWVGSDVARYERTLGRDPDRASRWRLAPNLTYYPTEFSKIRLQYNFDRRTGVGDDHSVWMQFEFLLGTHAAHKF